MSKHFKISAIAATGFWRCGTHFPHEGKPVSEDDFSETQWDILRAEPRLRITVATVEDLEPTEPDERQARIAEVIQTLRAEDFQKDGKPKLDTLNDLLSDEIGKIKALDRDAAWDAIQASGFETPETETGD